MDSSENIGLIEFLVLVFKFFKRNILILSIFTVIGLGIGIGYSLNKANYYQTELVGFSNIIEKSSLLEILSPLTVLAEEKNYENLGELLNLTNEEASQIRSIEFSDSRHTKTSHNPAVTDKQLGELIVVNVNLYDLGISSKLENGLTTFLSNNSYIQTLTKLERNKIQSLVNQMESNLARMDSTYSNPQNASIKIQSENPVNYNETVETIETLKIDLQVLKPFTVVSPFYEVKKPQNRNILISIAATVAFFVLGLFIVLIKEIKRLA